jgi:phosphoribosyl 1,2-cyclic phosphate phosphodiesterase
LTKNYDNSPLPYSFLHFNLILDGGFMSLELLFLGTSAALQLPAFHCTCEVCEAARRNPGHRRTRASVALLGEETVLIDAGPDLEFQLEREMIRRLDRIFLTHWHFDHVWGLAALGEPASIEHWPPIDIYLPSQIVGRFNQQLGYMAARVELHPVEPGDVIELPDASWEVVKTKHTDHSVGYVIESSQRVAYLVDTACPPEATMDRLGDLALLILDATVDELVLDEGEQEWGEFSLPEAVEFWKEVGAEKCILTHLSCHRWIEGRLLAGLSHSERRGYEERVPNLRFAYDGMRVPLG